MLTSGDQIVDSYSGGILVTGGLYIGATFTAGTFLVLVGGGHTISYDELYAWGPMEGSPTWNLLRGRTSPIIQNADVDGNGNPVTGHSYSGIVYPGASRGVLLRMGCLYRYSDTSSNTRLDRFNFLQASPGFSGASQPWLSTLASMPSSAPASLAAYETSSDRVWYMPTGQFDRIGYYDCAANTHSISAQTKNWSGTYDRSTGAIDNNRGIFASIGGGTTLQFYRTNNGTGNDWYVPSLNTTSASLPTDPYTSGFWDSVNDRFVLMADTGNSIRYVTPPASNPYQGGNAWVVTSVTPGGVTVPAASANGTYGRFLEFHIAGVQVYLRMNSGTSAICAMRVS